MSTIDWCSLMQDVSMLRLNTLVRTCMIHDYSIYFSLINMKPIAIFYHVYQKEKTTHNPHTICWEDMFREQINRIKSVGLFDVTHFIQVNVNGNKELPINARKIRIKYNSEMQCESDTLLDLWNFANNHKNYAILYFHTKGISFIDSDMERYVNSMIWREYLEFFNIDLWKINLEKLNDHDTSGTELVLKAGIGGSVWSAPCYAGNFWWANASYICNLDPTYIIRRDRIWWRWASEFWLGTKNPKMFNFYSSSGQFGKDKYFDPVTKEEAINNIQNNTVYGVYNE